MSTTLYDLSVPVYIRALEQLAHILKKGEQWADENKVPHEKLLEAKLYEDMKVRFNSNDAYSAPTFDFAASNVFESTWRFTF